MIYLLKDRLNGDSHIFTDLGILFRCSQVRLCTGMNPHIELFLSLDVGPQLRQRELERDNLHV